MHSKFSKFVFAVIFGSMFAVPALAHEAATGGGWTDEGKGHMHERFQERVDARLDKLAARLSIKDSQKPAWEAYVAAVKGMMDKPGMKEGHGGMMKDEDAAAMIHRHAEHAADRAKKLEVLADATDKLQAVLDEGQRKTFNREVRHHMEHMKHMGPMGRMGHYGSECGEHEGHDHEQHH